MSETHSDLDVVARRWLDKSAADLHPPEKRALGHALRRKPVSRNVNQAFEADSSFGERLADRVGEVVRLKARNEELSGERSKAEVVLEAREGELRREAERLERDRDHIEGGRREYKEKLEKLERECSVSASAHMI